MKKEATMLTPEEIEEINRRCKTNADALIAERFKKTTLSRSSTGPDCSKVVNPLAGYIISPVPKLGGYKQDCRDDVGGDEYQDDARDSVTSKDFTLYPRWCLDVVEGIARLNWYRTAHQRPLSVKKILTIIQRCPQIDKYTICSLYRFGERQAQRYLLACKMAIQHLIKVVPDNVRAKMDAGLQLINMDSDIVFSGENVQEFDDVPDVLEWKPLRAEWIAKLQEHCKPFTVYNTAEYYESDVIDLHSEGSNMYQIISPVTVVKTVNAKPSRERALELIQGGMSVAKVSRETGMHRNTISRWKAEMAA